MKFVPSPTFAVPIEIDRDAAATRLRVRALLAYRLIVLLLVGFVGLAALLAIDGAIIGQGEVAVESSVKTLSHPTGGVLKTLLVRDGDRVREGQILMRLDTSVSAIGADTAALGLEQLLARRARLEAERDGDGAIAFPPELTARGTKQAMDAIAREQRFFQLRRRERSGMVTLLQQRKRQYLDQVGSYDAQITAIDRQTALIQPELAGIRSLHDRQLVTINRLNEIERTAVQLSGSKAALESNIAEARARMSEADEQMLNVDKQSRSDAASQLAEVVGQLNEQKVRAATAIDLNARSDIRAPQSGTVDKIAFLAVGSAIPAGQPLLQIVPDRDTLIIEARVRPQDIDQIHEGQSARVVLSGLNRQTTPDFMGKLVFVSPELTTDQHTGQSFYRIKVRLNPLSLSTASHVSLKAGMPAEIFIATGSRSILSFLIKPLLDQIRYALRSDG